MLNLVAPEWYLWHIRSSTVPLYSCQQVPRSKFRANPQIRHRRYRNQYDTDGTGTQRGIRGRRGVL